MSHFSAILVIVILLTSGSMSQEHPQEHPSDKKVNQEHPQEQSSEADAGKEHPVTLSTQAVTKDNLAKAIRSYVAKESAKSEGAFVCVDDKTGRELNLKLKKVHDDKLAALGDNTYFACADFDAPDGKVYDIDIFMKGEDMASLEPIEIVVHKEEGIERYTWMELDGIWHKVAVEKE